MTRAVAQRVSSASVEIDGRQVATIDRGLLILLGIRAGDDERAVDRVADKIAVMRIFEDDDGKMNRSTSDVAGAMLVVSQFTLLADLSGGRRPSFIRSARPDEGRRLYEYFCARLEQHGYHVERGVFGARMAVSLVNDGPVTIVVESEEL